MKKKLIKKSILALTCLCLILAGCFIADKKMQLTADIPEHDGEVLVDSLNIQNDPDINSTPKDKSDTEMVTSDDTAELEQGDTYFEELRATITLDRNEVIAMLTDAEATADNSAEQDNASEKKTQLMENMQLEQEVETAIKTKGLPECLVLITENGVNVTVNKQELSENEVAQICDIVMRETNRSASQIIIQSKF